MPNARVVPGIDQRAIGASCRHIQNLGPGKAILAIVKGAASYTASENLSRKRGQIRGPVSFERKGRLIPFKPGTDQRSEPTFRWSKALYSDPASSFMV